MTHNTEALVLRFVDYGESDRIVHLLTPDRGRVAAIAKGARRSQKRFPGTLDIFNHLKIQLNRRSSSGMQRLEGAKLLNLFPPVRRDLGCFGLACYLIEMLDRAAPEGGGARDHERLFDFALDALSSLVAGRVDRSLRVLYELRALACLGFKPELDSCVRCGVPECGQLSPYFLVSEGGTLCAPCRRPQDAATALCRGTVRMLSRSLTMPIGSLSRLSMGGKMLEEADRAIRNFQRFYLGLELRSQQFVDRLS